MLHEILKHSDIWALLKFYRVKRAILPYLDYAGFILIGCNIGYKIELQILQNNALKPIFHWKWDSRWVPNANEIYTKNMKCTWPKPAFCVRTQRNLYSTDWRRGLASGKTQILALGNAKINQHVGISYTKFWHRGHCPTPTPDARYFVSQWNIGFRMCLRYRLADRVTVDRLHSEANLQSVEQRGTFQLLKLLYDYSKDVANLKTACRITRAGTKMVFKLPGKCTDKYINSPFYKGALLWDALPNPMSAHEHFSPADTSFLYLC